MLRFATVILTSLIVAAVSVAGAHPQARGDVSGKRPTPVATDNKVTIKTSSFKFEPKRVTVPAGTTVVWVNEDGRHTVEADKGEFKSPVLTQGQTFEFTFNKPGVYAYHCGFHGEAGGKDMAGTVVVTKKR